MERLNYPGQLVLSASITQGKVHIPFSYNFLYWHLIKDVYGFQCRPEVAKKQVRKLRSLLSQVPLILWTERGSVYCHYNWGQRVPSVFPSAALIVELTSFYLNRDAWLKPPCRDQSYLCFLVKVLSIIRWEGNFLSTIRFFENGCFYLMTLSGI